MLGRSSAFAVVASGIVMAVGLTACSPAAARASADVSAEPALSSAQSASPPRATQGASALTASFARLQSQLGGRIGLAVVPVGSAGRTQPGAVQLGTLTSEVAWSTSKVPLVIAALSRTSGSSVQTLARAAITKSDNAAAERLWRGLGNATAAGNSMNSVLVALGDPTTRTQTRVVRAGFSAFGQTQWTAKDQAKVASALPCSQHARTVYDLMGKIDRSQAWGLGTISGARFKGGWGPDTQGRYVVRQMGVLIVKGVPVMGVSILSKPSDGSFSAGTSALTAIAHWLAAHLAAFPKGHC